MSADQAVSSRVLIGWIGAAALIFAISLLFMGRSESTDTVGPSTYSRSAIGYAGIADVLAHLDFAVVKSRSDSLGRLAPGGVLVIAEPLPGGQTEQLVRTLLKADTILLILPKWTGQPSQQKPEWLGEATRLDPTIADWALHLVAPQADVGNADHPAWTTNALDLAPNLETPVQLMHGARLQPLIGAADGMLLGEIVDRNRRIWVLSDPDVIANHGLARPGNAAVAVAIIQHLRHGTGNIVFDETIHGFVSETANPLLTVFRFPFVIATIQGAVAVAVLLWATLGRFGTPQRVPAPMSAGRRDLLENMAKLVDGTGHRPVMVKRYVLDMLRDTGRALHAPRGLSTAGLIEWLSRVGAARGVAVDCGALVREAAMLDDRRSRQPAPLVRLAKDIHRWRGEILDARTGHPRDR